MALNWPAGWPRTPDGKRQRGDFGKSVQRYRDDGTPTWKSKQGLPWPDAVRRVQDEVRRMRGTGLTISTEPGDSDPGVVVAFRLPGNKPVVFPCDRYTVKGQNLAAIAATLDAKRAIERHGVSTLDREFEGYAALPSGDVAADTRAFHEQVRARVSQRIATEDIDPRGVLQVSPDAPIAVCEAAYKAHALAYHPDRPGGDEKAMARANRAIQLIREGR